MRSPFSVFVLCLSICPRPGGSHFQQSWQLFRTDRGRPSLQKPRFQAFLAQNRHFCALFAFGTPVLGHFEHKMVLRQISCCQVKQVWKILIQRSRSEARPYILLLIHFILLFRPSISPLLIEYFMAFLMGEMSRWTLFTKLTTSP